LAEDDNARKLNKLTKNLANTTAKKKAGLPIDTANCALYLASDEGVYVICQDIAEDGS